MITALIGSHGTGKSEVFNGLKQRLPDAIFFSEAVRHQMPRFGFTDPYQLIEQFGVGAFELLNINSWSVIDPEVNTLLPKNGNILTDRSAVENYAYFLSLAKGERDQRVQPLVHKVAKYYASMVDQFIYFPVTEAIPLVSDDMRPGDVAFQEEIDHNIQRAFYDLGISEDKVYSLGAIAVDLRVEEITSVIGSK